MDIKTIIMDSYTAYAARDLEGATKPFADNVKFDWPVNESTSKYCGCSNGKQAFIDRLKQLASDFEFIDVRVEEIITDKNKAASRIELELKNYRTGKTIINKSSHFWEFENDKCVSLIEYYDSALVNSVL